MKLIAKNCMKLKFPPWDVPTPSMRRSAWRLSELGRNGFKSDDVSPERLRKANQVRVSLIAHWTGAAFEIVSGAESPDDAWSQLAQHYLASGLKRRRRLTVASYSMNMKLGELPKEIFPSADAICNPNASTGLSTQRNVNVVTLGGLKSQYDAEVRMLESSSD